jgi:hypothetical protein
LTVALSRDLLDKNLKIDSADVHADSYNSEAAWNYASTTEADKSDGEQSDDFD